MPVCDFVDHHKIMPKEIEVGINRIAGYSQRYIAFSQGVLDYCRKERVRSRIVVFEINALANNNVKLRAIGPKKTACGIA